ncbi:MULTISPECIES: cytochrome o ubiquinol oxidase subunit IV [unclassified Shimia]|uniref:cytochrome o ubiquinol oxidase subunit IV n=1 Tax=unclassified Shimia TaxID=2630038 RepID=UPI001AD9EA8F|nr:MULTISPECIES: cytochrome o ubiquinol oxidase subunit IV [unclassified Shimia]MBO9395953.1 cytochrome o ubiquinol oxidase subunit IV [Shimia sp. R9_2]MBO9403267.1 cytochrome o ubiquinol oxidase subunit IV [Shimia sp. R9_3]
MSAETHDSAKAYRDYLKGFIFSVILTVIPFYCVMSGAVTDVPTLIAIIFGLGAIQMLVHVVYFLHLTVSAEDGWQAMSVVFTVMLVVIIMAGSIWVMAHLHENMMPAHDQIERIKNLP